MNLFKQQYISYLASITVTTPKIFKANRYARSILKYYGKEIKIKQENKFYKTLCELRP